MSQYDTLDRLMLARLAKLNCGLNFMFLNAQEVRDESERLEKETGRDAYRVIDGRLQYLRKKGVIEYDSKRGWEITKTPNVKLTGSALLRSPG